MLRNADGQHMHGAAAVRASALMLKVSRGGDRIVEAATSVRAPACLLLALVAVDGIFAFRARSEAGVIFLHLYHRSH